MPVSYTHLDVYKRQGLKRDSVGHFRHRPHELISSTARRRVFRLERLPLQGGWLTQLGFPHLHVSHALCYCSSQVPGLKRDFVAPFRHRPPELIGSTARRRFVRFEALPLQGGWLTQLGVPHQAVSHALSDCSSQSPGLKRDSVAPFRHRPQELIGSTARRRVVRLEGLPLLGGRLTQLGVPHLAVFHALSDISSQSPGLKRDSVAPFRHRPHEVICSTARRRDFRLER